MKKRAKCLLSKPSYFVTKSFILESMELGQIYILLSVLELESLHIPSEIQQLMLHFETNKLFFFFFLLKKTNVIKKTKQSVNFM
jgi:hypothetical protein